MGSVGAPEVLVILVLALLVLGPERLPQAARTLGRWVGEIRKITGSLQAEVQDVVDEVMRPVNDTATVATESFTSTFRPDSGSSVGTAEPEVGTATSPSLASSDAALADEAEPWLPADVPLPSPAPEAWPGLLPAPPVDPSMN